MSKACLANFEWLNLTANANCVGVRTWPNIKDKASCNRAEDPLVAGSALTWDQIKSGLHMTACVVGSGAAIVAAVGSDGSAAPYAIAALGSIDCAVTFWENVGTSDLPPGGGGGSWRTR